MCISQRKARNLGSPSGVQQSIGLLDQIEPNVRRTFDLLKMLAAAQRLTERVLCILCILKQPHQYYGRKRSREIFSLSEGKVKPFLSEPFNFIKSVPFVPFCTPARRTGR